MQATPDFATVFGPIAQLFALGGPVTILLVGLSVFALALILIKTGQFLAFSVGHPAQAEKAVALWQQGDKDNARAVAERSRALSAKTVARAMALKIEIASDRAAVEDELVRIATAGLHRLQSGLRTLDLIAQIAPLLGLFGTVLGMIEAFHQLQAAGTSVDPATLAGGIWVALLTTAVGLAVAMPVSVVLSALEARLESERVAIETLTSAILSPLATTGSAERSHAA